MMRNEKCRGKRSRAVRASAAALLLAMLVSGCSETAEQTSGGEDEVTIPMILIVDSSTGIKNEEELITEFNRIYDGNGRRMCSGSWRRRKSTGRI